VGPLRADSTSEIDVAQVEEVLDGVGAELDPSALRQTRGQRASRTTPPPLPSRPGGPAPAAASYGPPPVPKK